MPQWDIVFGSEKPDWLSIRIKAVGRVNSNAILSGWDSNCCLLGSLRDIGEGFHTALELWLFRESHPLTNQPGKPWTSTGFPTLGS